MLLTWPFAAHIFCFIQPSVNKVSLLYVGVGISFGEDVGVLLPEDVPNSAAGDDF